MSFTSPNTEILTTLGEEVQYRNADGELYTITAIVDKGAAATARIGEMAVRSGSIAITADEADLEGITREWVFIIEDVQYKVTDIIPDGFGLVYIPLSEEQG